MYQKYILKICCGETDSRHYKMVLPGENFSNTWQEYKKKKKKDYKNQLSQFGEYVLGK